MRQLLCNGRSAKRATFLHWRTVLLAVANGIVFCATFAGAAFGLIGLEVMAAITLDPTTDPLQQGYVSEGEADVTPGPRLRIDDVTSDSNDPKSRRVFFAPAPELEGSAAVVVDVGIQIDPTSVTLVGEDTGVHFVLNTGDSGSVELRVACIQRGAERRIAIKTSAGDYSPGLLANWDGPLQFRIEKTATGGGRITLGAASETLDVTSLALNSRAQATFEFGAFGAVTRAVASFGPIGGDFNHDGLVNAADYVVWRKGLEPSSTQYDYNAWRANFGDNIGIPAVGAASSPIAVPEPGSLILLCCALLAVPRRRAR
ncbi:MAG: hypothetical protein L0Y44_05005 [Phycisphaerales bacterium]|nr:hypothetical protein [Phycisphaerales bacterium]